MNDLSGSFPFINQDGNSFSRIQSVHPLVSPSLSQARKDFPTNTAALPGRKRLAIVQKENCKLLLCKKKRGKTFAILKGTPAVGELPTLTREQRTSHGDEDRSITDARGPWRETGGGGIRLIQNRRIFESARVGLSVELTTTT